MPAHLQQSSSLGSFPSSVSTGEPVSYVDLGEFSRDLLHGIRWLHEIHGPIAAIEDGGQRVVFLFSPALNQQVLSDTNRFHARFFAVRGPKRSAQRRLTCGLLAMNGEQHRRNRRLVKEPFGLRAISSYGDVIARLTDELLDDWSVGRQLDMAEEMRLYMLRVTSTLLFGLDDQELAYRLGELIARWVNLNHQVGIGAIVPNDRFSNQYEGLLSFAEELEAEIMSMIRRRRASDQAGRDVLSILVRSHDADGGLSDEELVGQAAVLFSAAHMTTAHSLTWTLLLLAQHPAVMRDLAAEVSNAAHSQEDGMDGGPIAECAEPMHIAKGSLPKGDDLSLLDRVIKESMRLLPASAYSQRVNVEAVQLGPLYLPRGTGIVFTPLVTHRLPQLYPQPDRFLPDRWLNLRPLPYAYHPFGGGPRLCIGAPLATAIIRIALQKILTRFRLAVVPGAKVSAHIESTMLFPTYGLPMQVHPVDGKYSSSPIDGNIHELVDFVDAPAFVAGEIDEKAAPPSAPRLPR